MSYDEHKDFCREVSTDDECIFFPSDRPKQKGEGNNYFSMEVKITYIESNLFENYKKGKSLCPKIWFKKLKGFSYLNSRVEKCLLR